MSHLNEDNHEYIKVLGDEIIEQIPHQLKQNLETIPAGFGARTSRSLDRFTMILNLILGGWILATMLIFQESLLSLVTRLFAHFSIPEIAATQWYSHPYAIFLVLALGGVGIWWYDITDGHPRGKTTQK